MSLIFSRPSGTEDVVRVYAESETKVNKYHLLRQTLTIIKRLFFIIFACNIWKNSYEKECESQSVIIFIGS